MKNYGLCVLLSIGLYSVGLYADDGAFYSYNTYPPRIVTETIEEGGLSTLQYTINSFFKEASGQKNSYSTTIDLKDHLKDINAALDKAFKSNTAATVTFALSEQASTKKYAVPIKYKVLGLTIDVQSDNKKSLLDKTFTLQLDSFVHHDKDVGKPYKLPHASVVSITDITLEYAGHDNKTITLPRTTGIKFKKK